MNDSQNSSSLPTLHPQLAHLGFAPGVEQARLEAGVDDDASVFRVVRVTAEGCMVCGISGTSPARVPKKLRAKLPPVVGDWVVARTSRGELHVRRILPRATSITRRAAASQHRSQVLAANVDAVLICMGLDQDFRLPRLERWLSLAHDGGVRPITVLTKAGLVDDSTRAARVEACRAATLGGPVIALDVLAGIGIDDLEHGLQHEDPGVQTLALLGSSGVGKSTLLNYLGGDALLQTRAVSTATGKGRHTTSHRELFEIPGRPLLVVDTPGLREVGLWGDSAGVDQTFAELVEAARGCRFRDCAHDTEPGCAIKAGLDRGELDARRVRSWLGLREEQGQTAGKAAEHERRADARKFSKLVRATIAAKRR